jgi:hypothetical protein
LDERAGPPLNFDPVRPMEVSMSQGFRIKAQRNRNRIPTRHLTTHQKETYIRRKGRIKALLRPSGRPGLKEEDTTES